VQAIAESIQAFGFTNPVLVDDDNMILAGHGRFQAAKLLGLDTVPAIRISNLNDAQKRAYVLADNKLAERAGSGPNTFLCQIQSLRASACSFHYAWLTEKIFKICNRFDQPFL
jgi:ParB-like chromosome segregation protein Spo0J